MHEDHAARRRRQRDRPAKPAVAYLLGDHPREQAVGQAVIEVVRVMARQHLQTAVFLDRVMREMYFFRLQADPAREKRAELKGLLKVVAVTGTGELKKKIAELKKEIPKLAKRADMDRALARFLLAYRYVSIHHKTAFQPVFNRYLKDMMDIGRFDKVVK